MFRDTCYPPTLHLDDSGLGGSSSARKRLQWRELATFNVVLEEKMDGTETSFEFDDNLDPVLRYRGSPLDLSSRGGAERQFDAMKDWFLLNADAFFDRFENRYRVYGEWLYATHRIFYDALPCYFLEFDILDLTSGIFLDTPSRQELLSDLPTIHSVKVVYQGLGDAAPHPMRLVGPSAFKTMSWRESAHLTCERHGQAYDAFMKRVDLSDLAEGVYGKVEEAGEVKARFKWVRRDFVSSIVEGDSHWKAMPLVPNQLLQASAKDVDALSNT